jgi:hypothetical protein
MSTLTEFSPIVRADTAQTITLRAKRDAAKANAHRLAAMQGVDSNRDERAAKIAAGEPPAPRQNLAVDLANAKSEWADYERALEIHERNAAERRRSESARYLKSSCRPAFEKDARIFAEALTTAYGALVRMDEMKSQLLAEDIGFFPRVLDFSAESEAFFGSLRDKSGALGNLFRALVAGGHLNNVPKEIR